MDRPATTRATPLQQHLAASFSLLVDARNELGRGEYETYVAILLDRLQAEAAKLVVAEAHRATRQAAGH